VRERSPRHRGGDRPALPPPRPTALVHVLTSRGALDAPQREPTSGGARTPPRAHLEKEMNELGINSFEEFLLFYLAAGVVIGALWVILEAHVLLSPIGAEAGRRARQQRLSRVLAAAGLLHVGFALVAMDLSRSDDIEPAVNERARRRASAQARWGAVAGVVVLAVLCTPHLPLPSELPGVAAIEQLVPWEPS
jgi:hypothetical protein